MELDKTRIAIRERGFLNILDLALRVIRGHLLPLALLTAAGVAPFWWLNSYFTSVAVADLIDPEVDYAEVVSLWFAYGFVLFVLLLVELPLATAPVTLYLGQALFAPKVKYGRLGIELLKSAPQLLLLQALPRALLAPWVITWFLPFVLWPYLNEVILLERNPIWRRKKSGLPNTFSRIAALHSPNSGELLARAMATAVLGPGLVLALWVSLWLMHGLLTEELSINGSAVTIYLQLAIWCVAAFFAVARFLAYLDLRIRNEGWELELRMRAEAIRLTSQVAA